MCRFQSDMKIYHMCISKHNLSGPHWYLVPFFVHSPCSVWSSLRWKVWFPSLCSWSLLFLWPKQEHIACLQLLQVLCWCHSRYPIVHNLNMMARNPIYSDILLFRGKTTGCPSFPNWLGMCILAASSYPSDKLAQASLTGGKDSNIFLFLGVPCDVWSLLSSISSSTGFMTHHTLHWWWW